MSESQVKRTHPAAWVPTLYFAEGLPFYAVNFMALIFYQRMGVSNAVTTLVISLLAWPWTLKPLWSPLLEMYKTKKFFVILTQLVGGLCLVLLAASLPLPGYFKLSIAALGVIAFCSSTHDIVADGLYIASLAPKEQAAYAGWQGAFYNVARIFSMGGLIWLIGVLAERFTRAHVAMPMVRAWMLVFAGLGLCLVALSLYHARVLPRGGTEKLGLRQALRDATKFVAEVFPLKNSALMLLNLLRAVLMGGLLWLTLVLPGRLSGMNVSVPGVRVWAIALASLSVVLMGIGLLSRHPSRTASPSPAQAVGPQGNGPRLTVAGIRAAAIVGVGSLAVTLGGRLGNWDTAPGWVHVCLILATLLGAIALGIDLYLAWKEHSQPELGEFENVVVTFFRKPNILLLLLFIFLYRAGEGQVIKVGPLFLQADRATGGLGLTMQQFGTIYGTFGSLAFILGSILGGYFTSWLGLKRALLPLICVLNLPMLAYWYLSVALPTNTALITAAMSVEMFGYGFGFVGIILLMMQEIAPGKYQTAHYAFANSLMNLGVILPGAVSGWIQTKLGYQHFFVWVLISALPALLLARFIPIRGGAATPPAAQSAEA